MFVSDTVAVLITSIEASALVVTSVLSLNSFPSSLFPLSLTSETSTPPPTAETVTWFLILVVNAAAGSIVYVAV